MRLLRIFNRQKCRATRAPLLREAARHILENSLGRSDYELGIHLIDSVEMTRLNKTFLGHEGSTDVITFNHAESADGEKLRGEIFICIDDAVAQAKQFKQTWQCEIVRYLAHGILHLEGYDDTTAVARRAMKREENKLVKELSRRFDLGKLAKVKHAAERK